MFAIYPLIAHWKGDKRTNGSPYVYGRNSLSLAEFDYMQSVKRELESRGIECFIDVIIPE